MGESLCGSSLCQPGDSVTTRSRTSTTLGTDEQMTAGTARFPDGCAECPGRHVPEQDLVGSQTSRSIYIRGRGAATPARTSPSSSTAYRASAHCPARRWATAPPFPLSGGSRLSRARHRRSSTAAGINQYSSRTMTKEGWTFGWIWAGATSGPSTTPSSEDIGTGRSTSSFPQLDIDGR